MNIFNQNQSDVVASQLLNQAQTVFRAMVYAFNNGSTLFWNNPNGLSPQQISDSLGNNAKELFQLHYALGQLINTIKPESITQGLSVIGQFTMNEDGTVTIIEQPPEFSTSTDI